MPLVADRKAIRILNAEPLGYSPIARSILEQVGTVAEKELSRAKLLEGLEGYHVLIVRLAHQVDREVLEAGLQLRAIVSATTGLDHIDVIQAQARGIAVLSLQDETEFLKTVSATAEHTWALLLALLRRIAPASAAVQRGEWNRDEFRGNELDGKRLGLVGLGRLGCKVARYGLAFGMEAAAYDPYAVEWMREVSRAPTLQDLLSHSDVISLHVPLNDETRGLIGPRELSLVKPNAVLVNTSRGQLVDDAALVEALTSKRLAGAALDVVPHERDRTLGGASPLITYARKHDNLLITPHIGGATHESMAKTEIFMARKLKNFLTRLVIT